MGVRLCCHEPIRSVLTAGRKGCPKTSFSLFLRTLHKSISRLVRAAHRKAVDSLPVCLYPGHAGFPLSMKVPYSLICFLPCQFRPVIKRNILLVSERISGVDPLRIQMTVPDFKHSFQF